MQVVQVEGLADPDARPYRRLLKGMDAFEAHHVLAPLATLRYRLTARLADVRTAGVRLRLQGSACAILIALADDLMFVLPRDDKRHVPALVGIIPVVGPIISIAGAVKHGRELVILSDRNGVVRTYRLRES